MQNGVTLPATRRVLKKVCAYAVAIAGLTVASQAHAAYVVNVLEVGSDVVATGSGSVNLNGLTFNNAGGGVGFVQANDGILQLGSGGGAFYSGLTGPTAFGSGAGFAADSTSGGLVYIRGGNQTIGVVSGYTSGAPLGTSTATWNGESFASLGLTEGTYTWTWGSGQDADSYTLNIGAPINSAVPEPATWALMLIGFAAIGGALRRRASPNVKVSL